MRLKEYRLVGRLVLGTISMVLAFICATGVAIAAIERGLATQYYVDSLGDVCVGFGPPLPTGSCEWGTHLKAARDNVAMGANMMPNLIEGEQNVALDRGALAHATEATSNIAIGNGALESTTTGLVNVAVGVGALENFNSNFGGFNTATGGAALFSDTTGEGDVADGYLALLNTTGEKNVGVGYTAGHNITSGSNNIDIANKGVSSDTATTRIGTNGEQKSAFMAGVYGSALKGPTCSVRVNSEGQLGCKGARGEATGATVGGGIGGEIGDNGFAMSLYAQATPTPMFKAGTLSRFAAHFKANVSTNTLLVVQKNGANTAITCTVAAGTNTCSDNTNSAEFEASDTVLVRATYTGSNAATNPSWSAAYE